jgi:hypothetical protein
LSATRKFLAILSCAWRCRRTVLVCKRNSRSSGVSGRAPHQLWACSSSDSSSELTIQRLTGDVEFLAERADFRLRLVHSSPREPQPRRRGLKRRPTIATSGASRGDARLGALVDHRRSNSASVAKGLDGRTVPLLFRTPANLVNLTVKPVRTISGWFVLAVRGLSPFFTR